MSRDDEALIMRVTVTRVRHELAGLGFEKSLGFDCVYEPGASFGMEGSIVTIETESGVRGDAPGPPSYGSSGLAESRAARYLLGRNALDREQVWHDLKRAARADVMVPPGAYDCALWDLAGKLYDAPVHELLGGAWRKQLPCYASTFHGDVNGGLSTPEQYAEFARRCRDDLGYTAFKIHGWIGAPIAQEVATVLAVREAVGDDMDLMLDPAGALMTFADVLKLGRACDEASYFWLEDPFRGGGFSISAHLLLKERVRTPLLLGEHLRGFEPKADAIRAGAADFVRAGWFEDGGITGVMKVAALAEAFGLDVELHGGGLAHRHCMAVLRNSNYFELGLVHPCVAETQLPIYADRRWLDLLDSVNERGCLEVPDGPGLGVEIDWNWVDDHTIGVDVFE